MQKRANSLALWVAAVLVSILVYPFLAAGLTSSVGPAGGVDRTAHRCADQVAPVGLGERLRSPGDRT
jgi:hypothetical protein